MRAPQPCRITETDQGLSCFQRKRWDDLAVDRMVDPAEGGPDVGSAGFRQSALSSKPRRAAPMHAEGKPMISQSIAAIALGVLFALPSSAAAADLVIGVPN